MKQRTQTLILIFETEAEPEPPQTMNLFGMEDEGPESEAEGPSAEQEVVVDAACRFGLAVSPNHAIEVSLDLAGLKEALADATLPKRVHDLKAVMRALAPHGVTLAGPVTDVMLQSYSAESYAWFSYAD